MRNEIYLYTPQPISFDQQRKLAGVGVGIVDAAEQHVLECKPLAAF